MADDRFLAWLAHCYMSHRPFASPQLRYLIQAILFFLQITLCIDIQVNICQQLFPFWMHQIILGPCMDKFQLRWQLLWYPVQLT